VGDADAPQCEGECVSGGVHAEDHIAECGGRRGHWDTYEWAIGSDGKARRVEPSIRLLAHGVPARVGKLRAYGNAIVPQVAAEVIAAYMEAT
jgi:DNA (cytosine-5)-methyltransferase 1